MTDSISQAAVQYARTLPFSSRSLICAGLLVCVTEAPLLAQSTADRTEFAVGGGSSWRSGLSSSRTNSSGSRSSPPSASMCSATGGRWRRPCPRARLVDGHRPGRGVDPPERRGRRGADRRHGCASGWKVLRGRRLCGPRRARRGWRSSSTGSAGTGTAEVGGEVRVVLILFVNLEYRWIYAVRVRVGVPTRPLESHDQVLHGLAARARPHLVVNSPITYLLTNNLLHPRKAPTLGLFPRQSQVDQGDNKFATAEGLSLQALTGLPLVESTLTAVAPGGQPGVPLRRPPRRQP